MYSTPSTALRVRVEPRPREGWVGRPTLIGGVGQDPGRDRRRVVRGRETRGHRLGRIKVRRIKDSYHLVKGGGQTDLLLE